MTPQQISETLELTKHNMRNRLERKVSPEELDQMATLLSFQSTLVRLAYEDVSGEQFSPDNLGTLHDLYGSTQDTK